MIMRPKNWLVFNGKALSDFGVYISGNGTFSSAERDYEVLEVPGRSGDLLINKGRYKNVSVSYPAWIAEDMYHNLHGLRSFLGSSDGYCRLEDTYNPEEFRLGMFAGPLSVEAGIFDSNHYNFAQFNLLFNCKPQRYLKSGEDIITIYEYGPIINPTDMVSSPLIRVYGYGSFTVGDQTVVVLENSYPYITIDTDLLDCYYGTENTNSYVAVPDGFPIFTPGENNIAKSDNTITKFEIIPRWWRL